MSYDVNLKRGDTRTAIKATLRDTSGNVVNLSECSVRFTMADLRGQVKIDREVLIHDAPNGVVWAVLEAAEVDVAGVYRGEFEVTWQDGRVETYPNDGYISILIQQDLG